jgi:hypothetical protein
MPTTRTLMLMPPCALRCSWYARICSSIDEVDLAHVDPVGHDEHGGREVEDAADARRDHAVGDVLGGDRRGGDHADGHPLLGHDLLEVVEGPDVDPRRRPPGAAPGSASSSATTRKPRLRKPE